MKGNGRTTRDKEQETITLVCLMWYPFDFLWLEHSRKFTGQVDYFLHLSLTHSKYTIVVFLVYRIYPYIG